MNKDGLRRLSLLLLVVMGVACLPAMAQYGPTISCNSNDMRRHFCQIGPNDGVRLVRQHSDAACIQGRTFGVNGGSMWVDRGCRAEFQVIPDRHGRNDNWNHGNGGNHDGYDHDRGQAASSTVYCASDNMRRNYCNVGPSRNIRLVRQRSDAACQMNRTYGFSRDGIWVDRGCRADFEVYR
jgi:DUF3011 family protein